MTTPDTPDQIWADIPAWAGGSEYIRATSQPEFHSGYGHRPKPIPYVPQAFYDALKAELDEYKRASNQNLTTYKHQRNLIQYQQAQIDALKRELQHKEQIRFSPRTQQEIDTHD